MLNGNKGTSNSDVRHAHIKSSYIIVSEWSDEVDKNHLTDLRVVGTMVNGNFEVLAWVSLDTLDVKFPSFEASQDLNTLPGASIARRAVPRLDSLDRC